MKIAIKVGAVVGGLAVLGLLIWLVFKFAGGGADTHAKVVDDMISIQTEFLELIEGVNSVDDAKNANAELKKILPRIEAINERAKALGEPDEETLEELRKKVRTEMEPLTKRFFGKLMTVGSDPEIAATLDLQEVMATAQPVEWLNQLNSQNQGQQNLPGPDRPID